MKILLPISNGNGNSASSGFTAPTSTFGPKACAPWKIWTIIAPSKWTG